MAGPIHDDDEDTAAFDQAAGAGLVARARAHLAVPQGDILGGLAEAIARVTSI